MEGYRGVLRLSAVAGILALVTSGCAWLTQRPRVALPQTLPPSPTLEQVIRVVNDNSSRIHSFSTGEAVLSVPGMPSLRTNIAFERQRRLRLRAGTGITGAELDLGSNDELFWIWIKRQPPLYYCRHDQFALSPARRMLPIDPEWLVEALGIVEFDPGVVHQGPFPQPGGRLEIRTVRQTADGAVTKITVVDAVTGVVVEQRVHDCQGRLVARASASRHRRDPMSGLIMPGVVEIECPKAQLSMWLELGKVEINSVRGNPAELWAMPRFRDWPTVDLGNPNLELAPAYSPARPFGGAFACPTDGRPAPPGGFSSRPCPPRRGWTRARYR